MCPICWISGFIAVLFGGSFIATINHPISWIIGVLLIFYSIYNFYQAKKRGNKMSTETKQKNRRTIFLITFFILIFSEASLRYSTISTIATFSYLIIPWLMFILVYFLFYKRTKNV